MVRLNPRNDEGFLLDANVLIDFQYVDLGILTLIAATVGPLYVIQPVIDEVDGVTARDLTRNGVTVLQVTTEDILSVSDRRRSLSLQDALCVLESERRQLSCVTNDNAMRQACRDRKVDPIRGLQLLLFLVNEGGMKRARAYRHAREMRRGNPLHITEAILSRFRELLFPNP